MNAVFESDQTCYLLAHIGPGGNVALGSCFALGGDLLATAFHVVSGHPAGLHMVVPRVRTDDYQDVDDKSFHVRPVDVVASDPIHDLAVLRVHEVETSVNWSIGSTDDVKPGEPVVTLGFPHANDGRTVLTQQTTTVGARILMQNQGIKSKYAVLNTLLRPGQSGGPVVNVRSNKVVAVLVGAYTPSGSGTVMIGGVDPAVLHQTTHAISAEYLKPMMDA
ncbi:Trypsin-like peptidase domain-containing protein [Klenkia marina]|uniref:Trypsin-like peptidase domain-containing protein n=1 Tax=Klenkia marina TaxID=1960309 RepID=A0A1G4Y829_9ACTN|nr:serine protease [Klenkia marina]SCX49563.1 Trypsin-like peptidase domain-containing protein [Klenkia marina]